jgi:hypothetical protein
MLTSSFNHSKCSKKRFITSQRSRFVSKEESLSSRAKIVKKSKRFTELIHRSRDALRTRIMTNLSINATLIAMNMTKWTSENKKSWCHWSKNEFASFFRFFRRRRSRFFRRSNQNVEKNEWCLILKCLFAKQFKIKSRKKKMTCKLTNFVFIKVMFSKSFSRSSSRFSSRFSKRSFSSTFIWFRSRFLFFQFFSLIINNDFFFFFHRSSWRFLNNIRNIRSQIS